MLQLKYSTRNQHACAVIIKKATLYIKGHQAFFADDRITARLTAAGQVLIESRYALFRIFIYSN